MISVTGNDVTSAFWKSLLSTSSSNSFSMLALAERVDEEVRVRLRGLVDRCDRSVDPVRRLVRVARNLVVDEDGVPVRGDGVHVSVRADDVLDARRPLPGAPGRRTPRPGTRGRRPRASRSGSAPTHRPSSGRRRRPFRQPVRTRRLLTPGRPASPSERRPCRSRARPRRRRASRRSPSCGAGRSNGPCGVPGSVGVRAAERRCQMRSGVSAQGPSGTCESSWPVLSVLLRGSWTEPPQATSARVRAQRARDGRWRPCRPYTR